jgi:hypothetical protein
MSKRTFDSIVTELRALRATGSPVFAVHYACGDLYRAGSEPPSVCAIAFEELTSGDVIVYSVVDRPTDGEQYVLTSYFDFLKDHPEARFVHWNMRSADFGFRALQNRYAHLMGQEPPQSVASDRDFDVDDLVSLGYGEDFADHPKLKSLAHLNGITLRSFLPGKVEAERFSKKEHAEVRRSVVEKVSIIAKLAKLTLDGALETKRSGRRIEFAAASLDSVGVVTTIGARFLDASRQLKRRHGGRPTLEVNDEYDAQDLFHALLKLFFEDIRPEEWTPSYAGAGARVDFILPRVRLAIELKNARPSMTTKELGEQLIADILKYGTHPNVRHLVCLVFDPGGLLANPRGIESDLSQAREGLGVTVRIYDR